MDRKLSIDMQGSHEVHRGTHTDQAALYDFLMDNGKVSGHDFNYEEECSHVESNRWDLPLEFHFCVWGQTLGIKYTFIPSFFIATFTEQRCVLAIIGISSGLTVTSVSRVTLKMLLGMGFLLIVTVLGLFLIRSRHKLRETVQLGLDLLDLVMLLVTLKAKAARVRATDWWAPAVHDPLYLTIFFLSNRLNSSTICAWTVFSIVFFSHS